MNFVNSAVPFVPKNVVIYSAVGGIASIFLGPFALIVGVVTLIIAYLRKSNKWIFTGLTMTFMGIAYFVSSIWIELLPSPLFAGLPISETVVKNTTISNTSGNGIASAFRLSNGIPLTLNAGDVWYNTQDTQYEGYDGSDVVILG